MERPPPSPDENAAAPSRTSEWRASTSQHEVLPAAAAASDCVTLVSEDTLPDSLLSDIGAAISCQEECITLVVKLDIGEDAVFKALHAPFTEELTLEFLKKWRKVHGEKATGAALHAVLHEIERRDLAERFEDRLFGRNVELGTLHSLVEGTQLRDMDQDSVESGQTDIGQMMPSISLLHRIASYLPKMKLCVRLAEQLGLGEDFVERLRGGAFSTKPVTAALNVLGKWKQKNAKQATGKVLFEALVAIRRRDIAACFSEDLLGQEVEDLEDFCFDDNHRDFFRLLRHHSIDVVATYEKMRCSADFLSVLHRKHVLTHPEYNELLESSQTLLRHAANKELMNVINNKPSQLQEMFADLLNQYQPQLIVAGEGGSSTLPVASNASGSTPWEICQEDLLLDFKEELTKFFNQLLIVRPFDFVTSEEIQPVSEMYVTLSSISYEEALKLLSGPQQLHGNQLLNAATQVDAEAKHSQELLNLHSLLCHPQGKQEKSALLLGSAGSGKSLTTLKILSEWISKDSTSPFQQFDAVIYITGRQQSRLNAKNVKELWQLQQMGYNECQEQLILDHFTCQSEKVLFLIDAWDEAGDDGLLQDDSVLKQILGGDLFKQSSVIITSRPSPNAYPLLDKCKCRYSLVGFNNKRLKELFRRRLDEPRASQLFNSLCRSSHLHVKAAVQKTPLFAAMLVQLYKMDETLPSTTTALYQLMLDSIRQRYVQWVKETQASSRSKMMTVSSKAVKADFDEAVRKLSGLALAGLVSNKVTFTKEEVMSCGEAVIKPRFGLLSEVKEINVYKDCVLYHFNHLTWQEYLAANVISTDTNCIKKLKMCISSVGVGEHTRMFWRFLAGHIDFHLLPDVIFELTKAGGISGAAPWETEFRLFLLDCVAEFIRMRQMHFGEQAADLYVTVELAAEMIASSSNNSWVLRLNGCILDASHMSSIAVVLKNSPNIRGLSVINCRVERDCPSLSGALHHMASVELHSVSGEGASFLQNVFSSLIGSSAIIKLMFEAIHTTSKSLIALAELINCSLSLTDLSCRDCAIGQTGLVCLSSSIQRSSSLSLLVIEEDNLAGAGDILGEVCAKMPQLQDAQFGRCFLDDNDFAGLLAGLQNIWSLTDLHVEGNQLTDDCAVSLVEYAISRDSFFQQVESSFHEDTPELAVFVAWNNVSEETIGLFTNMLPAKCRLLITNGHVTVGHGLQRLVKYLEPLPDEVEQSADGYLNCGNPGTGDRGAIEYAQYLTTNHADKLKSLALHDSGIGDRGAEAIAAALVKARKLQGLDLSSNCITLVGFYQLMSAMAAGSALQFLNVGDNPIFASPGHSHSDLTPSIYDLSLSVRSLEILSLGNVSYNDQAVGFENSPLALMTIPSLFALDLSNNCITDQSITMVTRHMGKLEYLSLSGNRISSSGGRALMKKAESLLEAADVHQQLTCCLKRIWLGGNLIDEAVFADNCCETISSESFSIRKLEMRYVLDLFSSRLSHRDHDGRVLCWTPEQKKDFAFWNQMKAAVEMRSFASFVEAMRQQNKKECFWRWLTICYHTLVYQTQSNSQTVEVQTLLNLFAWMWLWYLGNEVNVPMALAVMSCRLCVLDELITTYSMPELQPDIDKTLRLIAEMCALDSDYVCLTVQYLSEVAECCRQQQLHTVAEMLLQQMENIGQVASTSMNVQP